MAMHGSVAGCPVPAGALSPTGSFGRMFPDLESRKPTGLSLAKEFGLPGGLMDGGDTDDDQENPGFASGFTYLGQFIDHDLTLDATSSFERAAEAGSLVDFRSPRLDLDTVYGSGPVVSEILYDPDSHQTKLAVGRYDFARTEDGIARVGDPRNDENMLLAQLHVAFLKFHNKIVDGLRDGTFTTAFGEHLPPKPPDEPDDLQDAATLDQLLDVDNYYGAVFEHARRLVRWHYQWILLHDFLPTVADPDIVKSILEDGPRFFDPGARPFLPVEFAAAAFRMGHPTIRSTYRVNEDFAAKIFPDDPEAPTEPRTDLRGGRVRREHTVDWRLFFSFDGEHPQFAKRLDATLNGQLLSLPVTAVPGAKHGALARPVGSLVVRNLLRSEVQGLPSGQDVARKIGEHPIPDEKLGTTGPVYLWYYILKEAEILNNGRHLGPVGSVIVAETLVGLLDADPTSYRSAYPAWKPTLSDQNDAYDRFDITDLLRIAGVVKG